MMKWFLLKPRDEAGYPDLAGWLVRAETTHDARGFVPQTAARTWDAFPVEKDGARYWNPWKATWNILPQDLQESINLRPIE